MGTYQTPGHKPENNDILSVGCWAENDDGSRILVNKIESKKVYYQVFNIQNPSYAHNDVRDEEVFKDFYSSGKDWFWHDKTPFPWKQLTVKNPIKTVDIPMSEKVAKDLNMKVSKLKVISSKTILIGENIKNAIGRFLK